MRLQDLPRSLARRCLGIPRFCRDVLDVDLRGTRLVLAYSTGLDSTALLRLFCLLRERLGLALVAAHVHHGLRPASDQELEQALAVCRMLRVPCETSRLDLGRGGARQGLEERARNERYAFLEQVRVRHGADWIVTAHHADDLTEDIVMRLVRGTGWPGLGGMPGRDDRRRLLRPLLDWDKRELFETARALGAVWCEDASNADLDRTRSRIRHQVLPLLRRENPALAKTVLHLWRLARLDADYWSTALPTALPEGGGWFLDDDALRTHPARRLRLYKAALDAMGPGQALAAHLLALDRAWREGRHGRTLQFPGDKVARIEPSGISFLFTRRPESSD